MNEVRALMEKLHINVEKTFVPNPPAYLADSAYEGGEGLDPDETPTATWHFQTAFTVPMKGICLSYATYVKPQNFVAVTWPHDEFCFWQASFYVNQYLEAVTLHVRLDQQYESFCFEQSLDSSLLTSWRNFNFHKEHARVWSELLVGGKFREFTALSADQIDFDGYDGIQADSSK